MTSPSRLHTSVKGVAYSFSVRCFAFRQYACILAVSELARGSHNEGMYGSAGDIAPISMTSKYDNATASSIKGFKKILAGMTQRSVHLLRCKDIFCLILLCGTPTEHDLGCDGLQSPSEQRQTCMARIPR